MNAATILGTASVIALWAPVVLILVLQMWNRPGLLALLFYYVFVGLTNSYQQKLVPLPKDFAQFFNTLGNFLDVPLMLISFTAIAINAQVRRQLLVSLALFSAYILFAALYFGWSHKSAMYVMGPGIIVIMWYSIIHFNHFTRMAIERNRGVGQSMMSAAVFFAYGCYGIIYWLAFINRESALREVMFIYYIVNLLSAVLMSIGLVYLHRHNKQIDEVQQTRRELAIFFDN